MTWPQAAVLVMMVLSAAEAADRIANNRRYPKGDRGLGILIDLALRSVFAYALHVGGFW